MTEIRRCYFLLLTIGCCAVPTIAAGLHENPLNSIRDLHPMDFAGAHIVSSQLEDARLPHTVVGDSFQPQSGRRLHTNHAAAMCMHYRRHTDGHVEEDNAAVMGDVCTSNFALFGEDAGQSECEDPDFGGLSHCCYNGRHNTCTQCYMEEGCNTVELEKCVVSGEDLAESESNFAQRVASCLLVGNSSTPEEAGQVGFWQQAGFVSPSAFVAVAGEPFTNEPSVESCGLRCAGSPACEAFGFKQEGGACCLLQIEGPWLPLCPQNKSYCMPGPINVSGTGMELSAEEQAGWAPDLYFRDAADIYCASNSVECAKFREYRICMDKWGCSMSEPQLQTHAELCAGCECTAAQCGLPQVSCNATAMRCAHTYTACVEVNGHTCNCTSAFAGCMTESGCLNGSAVHILGVSLADLCFSEGCSAAECGLSEVSCNQSAAACSDSYLACTEGGGEVCGCTRGLVECIEETNCFNPDLRAQMFDQCKADGCSDEECGFLPDLEGAFCTDSALGECRASFQSCQDESGSCGCVRDLMSCLTSRGCQLSEHILEEMAALCVYEGCTAADCGICEGQCNATTLRCAAAHQACAAAANGTEQECGCAAAFYNCSAEAGCMTAEVQAQHADMCFTCGCTAAACGLPEGFRMCNQTDVQCTRHLAQCVHDQTDPNDRCFANYEEKKMLGESACYDRWSGGIPGCKYNAITDLCYTSVNCNCSRDYFECMHGGGCVDEESNREFARMCAADGCTAAQCGLQTALPCNYTAQVCAESFAECEVVRTSAIVDGISMDDPEIAALPPSLPGCHGSLCLRNYFQCMDGANCVTDKDLASHRECCEAEGCLPEECGLTPIEEQPEMPVKPARARLRSQLGNAMSMSWEQSALAKLWRLIGSRNYVVQYYVEFYSGCELTDVGVGEEPLVTCSTLNHSRYVSGRELSTVFEGGLEIGRVYRGHVQALNLFGISVEAEVTWSRHFGLPGATEPPVVERVGSFTLQVTWSLPEDTGDGTQTVPIEGYRLEISRSGRALLPVVLEVDQDVRTLFLQTSLGGTFQLCAQQGEICFCFGVARFGNFGVWSPPYSSQGGVLCDTGPVFPDVLQEQAKVCECNTNGIALERGEVLSVRVAARNELGYGPLSGPGFQKIMGVPGPVSALDIDGGDLSSDRIQVFWSTPEDTGFGELDTSANITNYLVVLGTCDGFRQDTEVCSLTTFPVDPATCSGDGQCAFDILEDGNLQELRVYYITVLAENEVGRGYLSQAPVERQAWKLIPTFIVPTLDEFPLRVVEWEGESFVWWRGAALRAVSLIIRNLPRLLVGSSFEVPVERGGEIRTGSAEVSSRRGLYEWVTLDDDLGLDTATTLRLNPPVFGMGEGEATATLEFPGYSDRTITFDLSYFEYLLAHPLRVAPVAGPLAGNNPVSIDVEEDVGLETRVQAGLPNFLQATAQNTLVTFNSSRAYVMDVAQISETTMRFMVLAPTFETAGPVTIDFSINNEPVRTTTPIRYTYRGEYIQSVVPANGLVTGGQQVTILVREANVEVQSVLVQFAGFFASSVEFQSLGGGLLSITAVMPVLEMTGPVVVTVFVTDASGFELVLTADGLFSVEAVPVPVLNDNTLRVDGEEVFDLLIPLGKTATLTFTVDFLGPSDTLTVLIGSVPATDVTWELSGPENDPRQASTDVTAVLPASGLDVGAFPVSVTSSHSFWGSRSAQSDALLEFRDFDAATVVSLTPTADKQAGGRIVLAGLISFCVSGNPCPPNSISVRFTVGGSDVVGTVFGAVSLASWLAEDEAYLALVGGLRVSEYLATIGAQEQAELDGVVQRLERAQAERSSGNDQAVLVFFQTPAVPISVNITTAAGVIATPTGNRAGSFLFDFVPNPIGPATVVSFNPREVDVGGGTGVTVRLSNFMIVSSASDLSVFVNSRQIPSEQIFIVSSSTDSTVVTFVTNPTAEGPRSVRIYPNADPENLATFRLTFLDTAGPEVVFNLPEKVYVTNGGDVIARVVRFGDGTSDYLVSFVFERGVNLDITDFAVSFNVDTGEVEFVIPAPDSAITGSVVVLLFNSALQNSASFSFEYIPRVDGPANLVVSPTTGPTSGGYSVQCYLTSFQLVEAPADVEIRFAGEAVASSAISSLQSSPDETILVFTAPTVAEAQTFALLVWPAAFPNNVGQAQFEVTDPLEPMVLFVDPAETDNATVHALVTVGVQYLQDEADEALPPSFVVSEATLGEQTAPVIITEVRESSPAFTELVAQLPLPSEFSDGGLLLPHAQTVQVSLRRNVVGSPPVFFDFTYHPLNVRVAWFRPAHYFTDGRVDMLVHMLHFPAELRQASNLMVVFAPGGELTQQASANATAISYTPLGAGRLAADVTIRIPQHTFDGPVTPFVVIPEFALDYDVVFPSPFTYRSPPDIATQAIIPDRGSIFANTLVAITVQNFPGVAGMVQDIVVMVGGIVAEVVEFESLSAADTPPMALHTMRIRFRTPCCSTGVTAGDAEVVVYNIDYSHRVGAATFSYFDPTKPVLTGVVGDFGENQVAVSQPTLVTLSFDGVPQTQTVSNTVVLVDGQLVEVKLVDIDDTGSGVIVILVPTGTSEEVVQASITFEAIAETITFELHYYDDSLPSVLGFAPSSGPVAGSTRVFLTLASFPTVEAESEVIVLFGEAAGIAQAHDITLVSSDAAQTVVSFLTPGREDPGPTRVRVKHIDFQTKEVELFFTFEAADPYLVSQSRTTATSAGGDVVTVIIAHFPVVTHKGTMVVSVDGQQLQEDSFEIVLSDADSSELAITLPPRPAGDSEIAIYMLADGPAAAILVPITYVDPNQIEFDSPASVPTQECAGNTGTIFLFVFNVQTTAQAGDFAVSFGGQEAVSVQSVTVDSSNQATLTVSLPSGSTVGDSAITVTYLTFVVSTTFTWLDCDAGPILNNPDPPEVVGNGGTVLLQFVGLNTTREAPFVVVINDVEVTVVNSWTVEQSDGTVVGFVQVDMPAADVDGTVDGAINRPDGSPIVTFPVIIRAPCVYEGPSGECATRGLIANLIEIQNFGPTAPECDLDTYCMSESDLPVPTVVLGPIPTSGRSSGGETTMVMIDNFPVLDQNDILVEVNFPGGNQELGTVTAVAVNGLAGLTQQVELTIAMPGSPIGATDAQIVISTTYGTVGRENLKVELPYTYFQLLVGSAVVSFYLPRQVWESDTGQEMTVHLTNFPVVTAGEENRVVLELVPGQLFFAAEIISSDRESTKVLFQLPSGLSPAEYTSSIYYGPHGAARAGSLVLTVLANPSPVVTTLYPEVVQQGAQIVVTMGVQYLWDASQYSASDVSVALGDSHVGTVQSVTSTDADCANIICSLETIIFETPTDLPEGQIDVQACVGAGASRRCASTRLGVLPVSAAIVTGLVPSTAPAGTSPLVTVFLRNFRPVDSLDEIRALVNQKQTQPLALTAQSDNLWSLQLQFPELREVGMLPGVVYRLQDGIERNASFEFLLTRPPPLFSPVDAPRTGGAIITLTTYWQRVQSSNLDLAVTFDGVLGEVGILFSDNFVTRVEITTPELPSAGTFDAVLTGAGPVTEEFRFEFFTPPAISEVSPDAAALEGGTVVSLRVDSFPGVQGGIQMQVETLNDFVVMFDGVQCDGTVQEGRSCEVRDYTQHADALDIELVIPSGRGVGTVVVSVEYTGRPAPKEGGSLSDEEVVRSTRRAASRDFSYFLRQPTVRSTQYCPSCTNDRLNCIVGGLCPDGSTPQQGVVFMQGGGRLTITIENVDVVQDAPLTPAWAPRVTIGSESSPADVVVSEDGRVVLVMDVTPREGDGPVGASVNLPDGSDLPFSLTLQDNTVSLTCDLSASNCASGEDGGSTARFIVVGLPLASAAMVDEILVTFGEDSLAQSVTWVSSGVIDVVVPAYSSVTNKYTDGSVVVPVKVEFLGSSAFAETTYTYYSAPKIVTSQSGARLSSDWTSIEILFDADTNGVEQYPPEGAGCDTLIGVSGGKSLGDGAHCLFQGNRMLIIVLGTSPTIEPGDLLFVVADQRSLRSLNGLSPYSRYQEKILLEPSELYPPGPALLSGPSKIDVCGALELFFSVSWPRRLSFVWECLNCGEADQDLRDYLQTVSQSQVSFPELTPLLRSVNFEYLISAQGSDTLPTRTLFSDRRTIKLVKVEQPTPSLFFVGQPSYKASGPIVLKSRARFSKCGGTVKSLVNFRWGRRSLGNGGGDDDDDVDDSEFDSDSGNLHIVPRRLRGARTYSVRCTGEVAADPSMTNEQSFDIRVVFSPLVAVISGGTTLEFSESSNVALSGEESFDPDSSLPVGEDPDLQYRWTCVQIIDGEELPCRSALDFLQLPLGTAATLNISAGALVASPYNYIFRLFVKKDGRLEQSSYALVVLKPDPIPTVGMSQISARIHKRTGLPQLNSRSRLSLSSRRFVNGRRIGNGSLRGFRWRMNHVDENQGNVAPQGFNRRDFVLIPRRSVARLFFARAIYTISLDGSDSDNGFQGTARAELLLNAPPALGSCRACQRLAGDTQFTDRGECRAEVAALVGTLAVQCRQWMDEDLPMTYAFGYRDVQGVDLLNNPVSDDYGFIVVPNLPSPLTVIAQVADSLGATTDVVTMEVTVLESRRRGGERGLLALSTETIETAITNMEEASNLGQAEDATQLAMALFESLPASVPSLAQRRTYMARVVSDLRHVTENHAALTVEFAESIATALAEIQSACDLTKAAASDVLSMLDHISKVDTTDDHLKEDFLANVNTALSMATGGTLTYECGFAGTDELSQAEVVDTLRVTNDIVKEAFNGLLQIYTAGETTPDNAAPYFGMKAARELPSDLPGTYAIEGKPSFGTLPQNLGLADGRYDVKVSEGYMPERSGEIFANSDFQLLSDVIFGFSVYSEGSLTEAVITNLTADKVFVRIPVSSRRTRSVPLWKQRATCSEYDPVAGAVSVAGTAGCDPFSITETYVECQCDHLSLFAAAVDPSRPACGDGAISAQESCDDEQANSTSLDGCSAACQVETDSFCWHDNAGAGPSYCCAPCLPGFYRVGCQLNVMGPRDAVDGECLPCDANFFKPDRGNYNAVCEPCPPNTTSMPGAHRCFSPNITRCPPGEGVELDQCVPCPDGFYSDETSPNPCFPVPTCPPGSERINFTAAFEGVCATCPPDTYKTGRGQYNDVCTPCPSDSLTGGVNNVSDPNVCTCVVGFERVDDTAPFRCVNINECEEETDTCDDGSTQCTDTTGSFICDCLPGFINLTASDEVKRRCEDQCGDGLRSTAEECDDGDREGQVDDRLDGCSAECTVEERFVCSGGSGSSADVCVCEPNYYTPNAPSMGVGCSRFCLAANTCSARGRCDQPAGFCRCQRTYFGPACEVGPIQPLESDSQFVTEVGTHPAAALFWSTGHVLVRPNGLQGPPFGNVTLIAERYAAADLEGAMPPPAGMRYAGDVIDLHPDGITIASGYLVMSYEQLEGPDPALRIYNFNRDVQAWEALDTLPEPGDAFKLRANLSHFSSYAVLSAVPALVVTPPPSPTPGPIPESDGLNAGEIVGLVIGLVVAAALFLGFCWWFIQRRNRELFGQEEKLLPAAEPEPVPEPVVEPPPGDWITCQGCQQPVRSDWPRCPGCHAPVGPGVPLEVDDGAGVTATATVGFEEAGAGQARDIEPPADIKGLEEFSATCWNCHAPIKPSWPRCPACKADPAEVPAEPGVPAAVTETVEGFTMDCTVCQAPVKPTWTRCPTCRTPIAAPSDGPDLFGLQDDVAEHYATDARLNVEDQESVGELHLQDDDATHYPLNVPYSPGGQAPGSPEYQDEEPRFGAAPPSTSLAQVDLLSGMQAEPVFGGDLLEGLQSEGAPVFASRDMPDLQADSGFATAIQASGLQTSLPPTVDPGQPSLPGLQSSQPSSVTPGFSGSELEGLQSDSVMHSEGGTAVPGLQEP